MRIDESRSADDLLRPDGNSLSENYELHDVGSQYLYSMIDSINEEMEHWFYNIEDIGIDKRDEDETLIYDNKMDYLITQCDPSPYSEEIRVAPKALVDVKTKSSQSWMNVFNVRHYAHYVEANNKTSYGAYVLMCLLSDDGSEVGEVQVLPIEQNEMAVEYAAYFDSEKESTVESYGECVDDFEHVDSTFVAPDRNPVIRFDESYALSVDEWISEVFE